MLDRVADRVLDGFTEREFDAPFMAMLRTAGFIDVHFSHGSLEFGKDFVAKRSENSGQIQFVFQSKAGNLTLAEWASLQGQLTLLRTNSIGHPSFDSRLPRRAVLVITGRLNSHAQAAAQDHIRQLQERGETPLEIWDRDRIVELMMAGLSSALDRDFVAEMVAAFGEIGAGAVTGEAVDRVAESWCGSRLKADQASLWAAVLCLELKKNSRLDLACHLALGLIRAAAYHTHGQDEPDAEWLDARETGRIVFEANALDLWDQARRVDATAAELARACSELASIVTYRIRCARVLEFVALLGLMKLETNRNEAAGIAAWIAQFWGRHPGSHQPISDKWAMAFVPAVLLLCRCSRRADALAGIQRVANWVGQCYAGRLGLAQARATPNEEITRLFGSSTIRSKREDSYLATVVLDLAAVLEARSLYSEAVRDFRSKGILPSTLITSDDENQYLSDGRNIAFEANIPYLDELPSNGAHAAVHLRTADAPGYLERAGRAWDHLAVSSVLRDRHFPAAWRSIAPANRESSS